MHGRQSLCAEQNVVRADVSRGLECCGAVCASVVVKLHEEIGDQRGSDDARVRRLRCAGIGNGDGGVG